jgi:uncharacterized membrane protein YkvA (DUF1232 family)
MAQKFDFKLVVAFLFVVAIGVWWIGFFGLIPDSVPFIGIIDNIIITILFVNLVIKVKNHSMEGFKKFLQEPLGVINPILSKIFSPGFLVLLLVTAAVLAYIFWQFDGIPDITPLYGYVDDVGAVLLALGIFLQSKWLRNVISGGNK